MLALGNRSPSHRPPLFRVLPWVAALALVGGCSSSSTADPTADGGADSAPLADSGAADSGPDAAAPDTAPLGCPLVAPQIGGSAELDAVAKAPARCGQADHSWLASPQLGEIVSVQGAQEVSAAVARILLAATKMQAPEKLYDVVTERIAYETQDRGALHEATAMLAYPTGMSEAADLDVLLVLHGTTGFKDGCTGSDDENRQLLAALAAMGYVVVHPDYIGLRAFGEPTGFLHPYLGGQPAAISSIDSVRAAARRVAQVTAGAQAEDPGAPRVCASIRYAAIGGSQGGHTALWVDRLHPYYAPELELAATVASAPPSATYEHMVRALRAEVPASANTIAFYGATSDWYEVADRLDEVFLPPFDKEVPATMAAECDPSAVLDGKVLTEVFQPAFLAAAAKDGAEGILALDPWGCMAAENSLPRTSIARQEPAAPGYGILFLLGEKDTLVDPGIERESFDALCAQGMQMQYLECAGVGHAVAPAALPEILDFLRARLDGKPMDPATVCKRSPAATCRGLQ